MSNTANIYKFTENNDWEGEEWEFFVRLSNSEHSAIVSLLAEIEEFNDAYSLSDETFTEEEVRALVKNASDGYMDSHNYAGGLSERLPEAEEFDDTDPFYKGKFADDYCNTKGCEL